MKKGLLVVFSAFVFANCFAKVKPNSLFSNYMVLQRGVAVPIWGTAKNGESVTVQFLNQKVSTVANNGKWMVKLQPLQAGGPYTMIVSGEDTVTITHVLVGEVWVCGGQSNMDRPLGPRTGQKLIDNWLAEKSAANNPEIRQYFLPRQASDTPVSDTHYRWVVCDTNSVVRFSAIGYFFAKHLYEELKVPIGLLFSAFGGTPAEDWTTRASLEANPELKILAQQYDSASAAYKPALQKYLQDQPALMAQWTVDSLTAKNAHQPLPHKPAPPDDPAGGAGGLFNSMIYPLIPYAIKGVIWYQGEANTVRAKQYQTLFPTLINTWRERWNQGTFPFLFVQLAPFNYTLPELREAQFLTLKKVPNTAMVVTTDIGDSTDIHPSHKQPVGRRLALAARALAYNENIEYMGPIYEGYVIKGNTIEIMFSHIGMGLGTVPNNGKLIGFTIAGADKNFVSANAIISGNKVIVSSPTVSHPVAVRYGWARSPIVNLFNVNGLPASPFRTDIE